MQVQLLILSRELRSTNLILKPIKIVVGLLGILIINDVILVINKYI